MPTSAERRPFPLVPVVVAIVVVVLGIVAIVVSTGGGDDAEGQNQPVEVSGAALAPFAGGASDPAVGAEAPELRGASFDGSTVEITADGTPKLLVFVAHWCPHCNEEVPVIVDWLGGETSKDGVDVYAVSTDVNEAAPNFPPSEWLAEEDWPAPVLADDEDSSAGAAYGLRGFPYFVLLDGEHRVVTRGTGELSPDELDQLVAAA